MSDDELRSGQGRHPPDWLALIGVVLTVALHLVLQAKGPNLAFIVGASLAWSAYLLFRAYRDKNAFTNWGFRTDNLLVASKVPLALFAAVALALAAYAAVRGTLRFPSHLVLLLLLYPLWGLVQQFLALGVVVNNLERASGLRGRRSLLILVGAALFGLVHAHDWPLAAATAGLELVLIPLYLRHRNLLPLAVIHGWIGALFYLWVLNEDLWVKNFG